MKQHGLLMIALFPCTESPHPHESIVYLPHSSPRPHHFPWRLRPHPAPRPSGVWQRCRLRQQLRRQHRHGRQQSLWRAALQPTCHHPSRQHYPLHPAGCCARSLYPARSQRRSCRRQRLHPVLRSGGRKRHPHTSFSSWPPPRSTRFYQLSCRVVKSTTSSE